jgi:hypothetical protein
MKNVMMESILIIYFKEPATKKTIENCNKKYVNCSIVALKENIM